MSFGHWLKGATRIRIDDRTAGNLLKNGAIAGGTLVGGPVGLAIGAGGGILGQAALGGNLKESLNAGFKGAANTGFAQAGKGMLSHIGGGAPAGVSAAPTPAPIGAVEHGGLALPGTPDLTTIANAPKPSMLATVGDRAGGVFDWAADHPNAAAGALQGVGALATSGANNRTANAQADLMEKQAEETEYDFQRRKARDAQLAPVWSSLGSTIGSNYGGVARNPYLPGA